MNKSIWIFILVIVIITGVYFMVTKNNTPKEAGSPYKGEEIPQPPKLPE